MKTCNAKFASGFLALAVQSALIAMFAVPSAAYSQAAAPAPADDEVTALTHPTNFVELGIGNVSEGSAKFGEYNGLNKAGGYGIGNFSLRGGDAYDDAAGIRRWNLTGADVGLSSREMGAGIADQGVWSANVRIDQLYHAITDTFETPYVGVAGGNVFQLPSNFGPINTTAAANSPSQLVGTRNLSTQQLQDFTNEDVGVTRKNTAFGSTYNFDRQWSVQFDYNHLSETGTKILSVASNAQQGSASAQWAALSKNPWNGEGPVSLLNPYDFKTDTFNLAVNYVGEQAYFTASFFSSIFTDENSALNWDSPYVKSTAALGGTILSGAGVTMPQEYMSTAPSNMFNQLNFKGGYSITPGIKLIGGLSWGRNSQNAPYLIDNSSTMQPGGLPQSSLQGSVINKNANLKVVDSSLKDLALSAGFKYNERLNKTESNVYGWYDIDSPANPRINANTPYSNSKAETELAANYRLTSAQTVNLAYTNEVIERWCENFAAVTSPAGAAGGSSPANAQCLISPKSDENRLALGYRYKVSGDLNANVGYSYGKRTTTVDNNAITSLFDQGGQVNGAGYVNASNYPGFMSYFDASRIQDTVKAGVNWQPTDSLTLSASGRYNKDNYFESTLGEKNGHSSSLNLDAAFSYAENGSIGAYGTIQRREIFALSGASGNGAQDVSNNLTGNYAGLVAPTNIFSTQLNDKDATVGLNLNQKGLLDGKLELTGDASLSLGRTGYTLAVPYYVEPTTVTGVTIVNNVLSCSSSGVLTCGNTPDITNRTLQFKLTGHYAFNKHNKLMFRYIYQKENVVDYYYNGLQYGYTPSSVMPTNQVAPNYSVNVIALSYLHTF